MEIEFHGANCASIESKTTRVVVDDYLADLGAKSIAKKGDVLLFTGAHSNPFPEARMVIDHPGEYEISDVSIVGIPAKAHVDSSEDHSVTMYKVMVDDMTFLFTGHIDPGLTEAQLESIGMVDVLFVPVGGNGYTLDPIGALKVIKKIEPKLIIPTNYEDAALKYPVPQQSLENVLKELGMEPKDTAEKIKLKPADLSDITQLTVLTRS